MTAYRSFVCFVSPLSLSSIFLFSSPQSSCFPLSLLSFSLLSRFIFLYLSSFFLFLFLSLLFKHLSSLWSWGWQDKKNVSIKQSRIGRIDSETKESFTAVYTVCEYVCVCVNARVCVSITCTRSCLSCTLRSFSEKRQKME